MRTPKDRFEVRQNRVRSKIAKVSDRKRLSIFKSERHIYAQIIDDKTSTTLVAASTLDKEIRQLKKSNCNITTAKKVAELLVSRVSERGLLNQEIVFDKGGNKYHGIVKAFADAARVGLKF